MEDSKLLKMTSTLLGAGNNAVLSAVANILSKQQTMNQEGFLASNSPLLVLSKAQGKEASETEDVHAPSHGTTQTKSNSPDEVFAHSLEQVHALATANLLASTQRDIAQQLAAANTVSSAKPGTETKKRHHNKPNLSKRKDVKSVKKAEEKNQTSETETEAATTEPKALVCSFDGCNRKFAWSTHLKYHEMTHTNNRQFECPDEDCGKAFFTAQRLKVHLRTHTGEKPFKCTHADCEKTFTTAGNLKNHERIHTGEQPFFCNFDGCNKRFTESSSLRKHKLTHSGDKPFECKVCNKKFTQSGSRRQHLIRHHLDEEIRNSLKGGTFDKDYDKKESEDSTTPAQTNQSDGREKKSSVKTMPCSPQMMVLRSSYHQGLNEHIVTVTSASQHLTESSSIPLSHSLINPEGLHEASLEGKAEDLVVLSQAPIYQHEDHTRDIVYATDILDHEEVTSADYHMSAQVDSCSEEIVTPGGYHQEESNIQTDVSLHPSEEPHQSDIYQRFPSHEKFIQQHTPGAYSEEKSELSNAYLSSNEEVLHEEFIGAEEVTISTSSSLIAPEEDVAANASFITVKESMNSLIDWDEHLPRQ